MKIALLTCQDLSDLLQKDQELIPEFKKHNITAIPAVWDDQTINWPQFDYLLFRSTWDYFEKETQFNQWLNKIQKLGVKTLNTIEIIQENKHKFYLKKLEENGIAILPTIFVPKSNSFDLQNILPKHWKSAVLKPAVSAASYLTRLFEIKDLPEIQKEYQNIAQTTDLLLQQFMPEIQTLGETSFIFFNKKFSHCVLKKPISGDFRVQSQFGGQYTLIHPSQYLINEAQKVLEFYDDKLLYARVDAIVIDDTLHLMEVECIEPDLYFDLVPSSLEKFVNEIVLFVSK